MTWAVCSNSIFKSPSKLQTPMLKRHQYLAKEEYVCCASGLKRSFCQHCWTTWSAEDCVAGEEMGEGVASSMRLLAALAAFLAARSFFSGDSSM